MQFSIIVPVHNSEEYLEECLYSIDSQENKNYELILIVNASTDNSLVICQKWAEKHSNTQIIVTDIPGVSHARNMGIQAAKGDWLFFLDSDDCMREDALSTLERGIAGGCDLVIANYSSQKEQHNYSGNERVIPSVDYQKALLDRPKYFEEIKSGLTWNPIVLDSPWAKAFRTSTVKQSGIDFDCDVYIGEDALFNLAYTSLIKQVQCIDKDIYFYRVVSQSFSRKSDVSAVKKRLDLLHALNKFALSDGVEKAKEFKVVDILLRSVIAGSSKYADVDKTCELIMDCCAEHGIKGSIQNCRLNNLSKSKARGLVYYWILKLMKSNRYKSAVQVGFLYNNLIKIKEKGKM